MSTLEGERARERRRGAAGRLAPLLPAIMALFGLAACTPTVKVAAPEKPITINLNIKLDAEVRLRVEKKAEEDVKTKPIF